MQLLFLRGKVDERTQKTEDLNTHHDMWTQFAHALLRDNDVGEMLYWGGKRFFEYGWRFRERWVKDFKTCKISYPMENRDGFHDFEPDTIFCRGGFPEYHHILKRCPNAFKIYYGAGKRFIPSGFVDYDLILVDSPKQVKKVKAILPRVPVESFTKPAADNIFYPRNTKKKYDVCFVAAIPEDKRKRVAWVYKTLPKNLTMLQLGMKPKNLKVPPNVKVKHVSRDTMPEMMCQCKVGIVPYTKDDSGPRVIPEFLACGVVPVIMDSVMQNGHLPNFSKSEFWRTVTTAQLMFKYFYPEEIYRTNFSLEKTSQKLREIIDRHRRYNG